jgi:hypothetical protein
MSPLGSFEWPGGRSFMLTVITNLFAIFPISGHPLVIP